VSFYIIQTGGNQRKMQVFCERGNIQDVKKLSPNFSEIRYE